MPDTGYKLCVIRLLRFLWSCTSFPEKKKGEPIDSPFKQCRFVSYTVCGTFTFTRRPSWSNSTTPSLRAKRVKSRPLPTFSPG